MVRCARPREASDRRAMTLNKMLPACQTQTLRALRDGLGEAGFTGVRVQELLGIRFPDDVGLLNHAPVLERLRDDPRPVALMTRLFYLEDSVARVALKEALRHPLQRLLADAGLLVLDKKRATARLRVDVVGDHYVVADRRFRSPDQGAFGLPRGDMVYPAGADSVLLAEAVADLRGDAVLDLCTGSGVQGIAAAGRAREVVGIDISARAVAMARVNAALNGVGNCEFRTGDLYRPVGDRHFDLVLANPPFVPGPRRGPKYHSGGPRGERVWKRILNGLQGHLRPGGRAVLISHLTLRAQESVEAVLQPRLREFSGRALALVLESGSVVDLAAAQAMFALDRGLSAYVGEMRRWVRYLRRYEIEKIALVLLVAEKGGPSRLEVRSAPQATLPLPLSQPPRKQVAEWLRKRAATRR